MSAFAATAATTTAVAITGATTAAAYTDMGKMERGAKQNCRRRLFACRLYEDVEEGRDLSFEADVGVNVEKLRHKKTPLARCL